MRGKGALTGKTWALAVAAGAFTMTLIGGVAVAGFQPFVGSDQVARPALDGPAAGLAGRDGPQDKIKATLDALVTKGTLTQAQEDSILQALKDAAPAAKPPQLRAPNVRAFLGDLTRAARTYLGLSQKDLTTQLRAGKSLFDIANGTPRKSGAELVTVMTKAANDRVDQAVAAKKLTADQAATLKPKIAAEITTFVQRSFTKPALPPKPATPPKP
jgi:hypothetical protein